MFNPDILHELSQKKVVEVDEFEEELLNQSAQVIEIVTDMRSKIAANSRDEQNGEGFLIGGVDSYLDTFEG